MKLTIGTKNKAKVDQLKMALKDLSIEIQSLPDNKDYPEINENGKSVLDNARAKALNYAKLIGSPILSMDNGLFLEGLSDNQQPGLNVRHIDGRSDRPTDLEIVDYYSKLIRRLGGKINGYWEYGICIATPHGETKETTFRSERIFVSDPSPKIIEGYPLESLQLDEKTGKYSSEMTLKEKENFYQERETVGQKLRDFVTCLPDYFMEDKYSRSNEPASSVGEIGSEPKHK